MQADPLGEAETVAEARVHVVLEVRVGVHEARQDHRFFVVDGVAELLALPDGGDRAAVVVDLDGAVADRCALDWDHPVGRDDRHKPASA